MAEKLDKVNNKLTLNTEIFNKLIAGFSTSAPYLLVKEAPSVPYILSRKS